MRKSKEKSDSEDKDVLTPTKRNRGRRTPRGKRGTMKPMIQDENSDVAIARDVALMWQLLSLVDWTLQAACRTESGGDSYMQVFNLFEDLNVLVTPSHTAKNQNTEIKVYNQRIVVRTYNTYEAVHDARNDPRRNSAMSGMSTDLDEDEDLHKKFVRLQFDTMVEEELQISHENLAKLLKSANLETTVLRADEEIGKREDDVSSTFKSERALRVSVTDVSMGEAIPSSSSLLDRHDSQGLNVSDMRYFSSSSSSSSIKSISKSSSPTGILRSPIASLFRGRQWRPRLVELDLGVCPFIGQSDTKIISLPDVFSKSLIKSNTMPNMLIQLPAADSMNRCPDALSFRLLRRSIVYVVCVCVCVCRYLAHTNHFSYYYEQVRFVSRVLRRFGKSEKTQVVTSRISSHKQYRHIELGFS